jgi:anti-sigma-K factor RskA
VDRFEALIPAYALDALAEHERRELEGHLHTCDRCRSELRAYQESAASLAYATPLTDPPAALRERILHDAVAELEPRAPRRGRQRRPRWIVVAPVIVAGATAAIVIAVVPGQGSKTSWIHSATNRVALSSGKGVVVVSGSRGALLPSLADAPSGRTYEAWVVRDSTPIPAGTFRAGNRPVLLTVPVRPGDTVAVTVEPATGSKAPTSTPLATARV